MQTTLYFANDAVQILQGDVKNKKLSIKKFYTVPMEEGAMINGIITNEDMLFQALKTADDEGDIDFSSVTLVINSSLILNKNVQVPKLKPNELKELSKHEFEDTTNYENLIIDYTGIRGKNGSTNMFCCALEKEVLESYIHLFERAEIKLKRIDTALNATIKYVESTPQYNNQTVAINILDGNNLMYVLFENGLYTFSSRSRIMAERGSEGFTIEMVSKLSSLVQFNKSQKSEYILNKAFYAGLTDDEIGNLQEYLVDSEVAVFRLPTTDNVYENFSIDDDFDMSDAFYCTASFFEDKTDINLFASYREAMHPKKQLAIKNKWAVPPLVIVGIMVLAFGFFSVTNYNVEKAFEKANAYINDTGNISQYDESKKMEEELNKLRAQIALMDKNRKAIEGYPMMNSDKIYQVLTLGNGITVGALGYEWQKGALTVSATAPNEFAAGEYVSALNETALFSKIDYTGYTMNEGKTSTVTDGTTSTRLPDGKTLVTPNVKNVTTPDSYTFTVIGYLKPGVTQ